MNTILVPTDFSDNALAAATYAADMAQATRAKVVLIHAFIITASNYDGMTMNIAADEMKKENEGALKELAAQLSRGRQVKFEYEARVGSAVNEISAAAKDHNADLVVIGIRGMNAVSRFLIGSTSTAVVRHSPCPVIIVPEKVVFKVPDVILLATDNKKVEDYSAFASLRSLAGKFNSRVYIVHVISDIEHFTIDEEEFDAEKCLEGIAYSIHIVTNDDVEEGVQEFANEKNVDMLAVLTRKRSFFERLFSENHTKTLAFHSKIPVLAIPEK